MAARVAGYDTGAPRKEHLLHLNVRHALRVCGVIAVACALLAPTAAHADVESRTILLTDRFRPGSAPASSPLAANMVALRGETQGFQLLALGTGGYLHASVAKTSPSQLLDATSFQRIGWVTVSKPSTGVSLGTGVYEDPLPRQTSTGLGTARDAWAGWVVSVRVARDAAPGTYQGTIEIRDDQDVIVASVPYQVVVSSLAMIDPAGKDAFKVFAGFRPDWYRNLAPVRHDDLRVQFLNTHQFLADHLVSPTAWPYTDPSQGGSYSYQAVQQMNQYMSLPWSVRFVPYAIGNFSLRRNFGSKGSRFLRGINGSWQRHRWTNPNNTIFFTWDEPSAKNERVEIPRINSMVHRTMPGVKTLVTTSPKAGDELGNKHLYDGGRDDIDIWSIPLHRFYGRWTSKRERSRGVDNTLRKWKRIQSLRARHKQVWSNSYLMPTRHVPQMMIDGAPTDPRLIFWWNGLENTDGWLVWQLNRWVSASNESRVRDPYSEPLSYATPAGESGNGDVSLIYPPSSETYGLHDNAAAPVSSIRFETITQGIQDVNMIRLYRTRFGDAATRRALARLFGPVRRVPGTGYTWPTYSNHDLSSRLETLRRQMIARLDG